MPSQTGSRAAATARDAILDQLKADHKRVKKAYRKFTKLDMDEDTESCERLVRQVVAALEVHAALEEELLYPAARGAITETALIDEAEVEHESVHALINQLKAMDAKDVKFAARFTVLCEYVLHHVKEEESELFPQLYGSPLDWARLAREMAERRAELTPADVADAADEAYEGDGSPRESARLQATAALSARGQRRSVVKPRAGSDQGSAAPGGALNSRRV